MPEPGPGQPGGEIQHGVDADQVHKKSGLKGLFGGLFGHEDEHLQAAPMPEQPVDHSDMTSTDHMPEPLSTAAPEHDVPMTTSVGTEVKPGGGDALDLSAMPVKPATETSVIDQGETHADQPTGTTSITVESGGSTQEDHAVSVDAHEEGESSTSGVVAEEDTSFNDAAMAHLQRSTEPVTGHEGSTTDSTSEVTVEAAPDDAADFLAAAQQESVVSEPAAESHVQAGESTGADTQVEETNQVETTTPVTPDTPAADEAVRAEAPDLSTPSEAEEPAEIEAPIESTVNESADSHEASFPEMPIEEPAKAELPSAFDDAVVTSAPEITKYGGSDDNEVSPEVAAPAADTHELTPSDVSEKPEEGAEVVSLEALRTAAREAKADADKAAASAAKFVELADKFDKAA